MTKAMAETKGKQNTQPDGINRSLWSNIRNRIRARLFPEDLPVWPKLLIELTKVIIFFSAVGFLLGIFFEKDRAFAMLIFLLVGIGVGILLARWRVTPELAEEKRQRLQQQAELEEAKKLSYLGMMATATAHELNQPVGVIRAAADAALADLEEGYFQEEDIKPLLERIFAQTDRLAAIIENFRKFARGDRTHRERVELNAVVKRTLENFTEQFKHRNIVLKIELWQKKPVPIAWANPYQLEEVLINLLTNARDAVAGRENAVVQVKTWRRKGGGCGFSVEDNGPGLAPEYRQKMFTPFVSTKSTEKGTGLGLYISRRIIDELGGRLWYEDRPGGGARFIVDLPPLKG